MKLNKKHMLVPVLMAVSGAVLAQEAGGPVDVADAVSGIQGAGTAILAILGALIAMSVSIFGLTKVYGFIRRKAGA